VLPGFGLTLGYTLFYLSVIVLIPLAGLVIKTSSLTWSQFWTIITEPRVLASYRLSFGASLVSALINVVFGMLVAWVLVRYRFPAGGSSTPWSTCPSRCRRRSPASR
jgi:sulfate transport system permease protein